MGKHLHEHKALFTRSVAVVPDAIAQQTYHSDASDAVIYRTFVLVNLFRFYVDAQVLG